MFWTCSVSRSLSSVHHINKKLKKKSIGIVPAKSATLSILRRAMTMKSLVKEHTNENTLQD